MASELCQTVGDKFFFTWHIFLKVSKIQDMPSKIWKTLGDALNYKFIEMVQINDQASLFQCYFFKAGIFYGIFLKSESLNDMIQNSPFVSIMWFQIEYLL